MHVEAVEQNAKRRVARVLSRGSRAARTSRVLPERFAWLPGIGHL